MFLLIILLLLSVFLLFTLIKAKYRLSRFPPGPLRIPIFGNLLSIGTPPHQGVTSIVKKYGGIVGIYCGNYPAILLSDLQMISDAYNDDRFSARPPLRPFLERSWGTNKGLIFGTGEPWKEQRKFIIKTFKEFGFGSRRMEDLIVDEAQKLFKVFQGKLDQPLIINPYFHTGIINILWRIITGGRFDYDDPKLQQLIEFTSKVVRFRSLDGSSFKANILFFMPWLTKLNPSLTGWQDFIESFENIFPIFREILKEHRQTFDKNNLRDLIDIYLNKIEETKDANSSFYGIEGERNLLVTILDLFVAGGETASSNITWAILFLSKYPHIQEKVHNEIDRVVGKGRIPSLSDRKSMKYFDGFLNESLRMASIGVMSIFHSTTEEIPNFHGYRLPKDTLVFANLWHVHHKKEIWGDAENFRPERFIGEEIEKKKIRENLNVFSIGKRICPGEGLARDELFLFLTIFLQSFTFELPQGVEAPSLDPSMAQTLRKHPAKIIIKLRK